MICRNCGKEFEPKKRGRKNTGFCCKHCADTWRRLNVYDRMPKKYTKTCAICGKEFQTNREEQVYCSLKCFHATRRKGRTVYTKTCPYCGREFQTVYKNNKYCSSTCASRDAGAKRKGQYFCEYCGKPRHSDHPNRNRFCSRECAIKARILANLPRKLEKEWEKKRKRLKLCPVCGTPFFARDTLQKFCCSECRIQNERDRSHSKKLAKFKPKHFVCLECGKVVDVGFDDKRYKFCSNRCHDKFRSRIYDRERSQQIKDAFVEDVNLWVVYRRSNGRCGICGLPIPDTSEPSNIWGVTVDHIVPLSLGGKHSYQNCQAAHRLCNSLKQQECEDYKIDWKQKLIEEPGCWDADLDNLWEQLSGEHEHTV